MASQIPSNIRSLPVDPPPYSEHQDQDTLCINITKMLGDHVQRQMGNTTAQGNSAAEFVRPMLARIITNIGERFNCDVFPDINNLSAIADGNPTNPNQWDWAQWQTEFYGPNKEKSGRYFEKRNTPVPYRLLTYLDRLMTREQLFNLVQHEDVATIHESTAHYFDQWVLENKQTCNGFSDVYCTYKTMGVPLTIFIKTMIKLGYLTEQEIKHVFGFSEVHSVRQTPEARYDDHVKSVNITGPKKY